MAALKEIDAIDKIKPEHIFEVLRQLRECYDHVVLDPQHADDIETKASVEFFPQALESYYAFFAA